MGPSPSQLNLAKEIEVVLCILISKLPDFQMPLVFLEHVSFSYKVFPLFQFTWIEKYSLRLFWSLLFFLEEEGSQSTIYWVDIRKFFVKRWFGQLFGSLIK